MPIAHGIEMSTALQHQKALVDAGQWLLYRYNPMRIEDGQNPLQLDSKAPKIPVEQFLRMENRFNQLLKHDDAHSRELLEAAQHDVSTRWQMYQYLAERKS